MQKTTLMMLMLASTALLSSISHAHHSSLATFTPDTTTVVEGVIAEFRFRNPHVLIYLDVTNEDDSQTRWMAEGGSATWFRREGWDANTLKPGDLLRVSGDASLDGSPMVWVKQMEYLDKATGEVLAILDESTDPAVSFAQGAELDNETAAKPDNLPPYFMPSHLATGEPNFTGVTSRSDNPLYQGPPNADDPPLPYTDLGNAALDAWDLADDPQVFCDPPGLVRQGGYTPHGIRITQYPDHVIINYEEYAGRRAVFFDDELPAPGVRSNLGDSVARYEGDTLVIETVNLLENASGHLGKPLSNQVHMTEVYSRFDEPDYGSHLKVTTTIQDPKYLTEPWTISRIKVYREQYNFPEVDCVAPMRERPPNTWQAPD